MQNGRRQKEWSKQEACSKRRSREQHKKESRQAGRKYEGIKMYLGGPTFRDQLEDKQRELVELNDSPVHDVQIANEKKRHISRVSSVYQIPRLTGKAGGESRLDF